MAVTESLVKLSNERGSMRGHEHTTKQITAS